MTDSPTHADATAEHAIVIPRELLGRLVEAVQVLTLGKSRNHRFSQAMREAKRFHESSASLVCDGCGRIYADDLQADQESCDAPECGRFKQRMDIAKVVAWNERVCNQCGRLLEMTRETDAAGNVTYYDCDCTER